ncbi:hypothetical protein B9Z19DRAFT_211747 [Tuber borchii]|uniref:DUF7580 domain-containing protein n=1 Tax=Tuber borchii TaxID=42251 RepID=A0A2T7A5U5_TUBBO|nr:hypothetical protein B9Z19DRAFT_211747 [Tuber borchii]
MKLLTPITPEAETEGPSTTNPIAKIHDSEIEETNIHDVTRAESQTSSTTKPITVMPEVKEVNVVDIQEAKTQKPQKPSTTKSVTVISEVEEANIPNVKRADVVTVESNTPETAVQVSKFPMPGLPKPNPTKPDIQESDPKKPEAQEPDTGAVVKGTQASDLPVKPKKATDPQTSTPTDISKDKPVQDLKSKLTTGGQEVDSEVSSDSLPPTTPDIENLCTLTALDNLVPKESLLWFGSYSSSFFKTGWRSRDIFFFPKLETPEASNPDTLGKPYIILKIHQEDQDQQGAPARPLSDDNPRVCPTRSEHLFSLALALIEIGYRKPLWEIDSPFKLPQGAPLARTPIAEYMKAKDILDTRKLELQHGMGSEFPQVVIKCLFGDFGINEGNFCTQKLQQAFYKQVVIPLKTCLERHLVRNQP